MPIKSCSSYRIELGTQSVDEYRGFANDNESVQDTGNTEILVNKLEATSDAMTLIVTSIQKWLWSMTTSEAKKVVMTRNDLIRYAPSE